jgi:hypothetical protein
MVSLIVWSFLSAPAAFLLALAIAAGVLAVATGLYFAGTAIKNRRFDATDELDWEEDSEGGYYSRTPVKRRGLVSRFLTGIADFFNLIFQFVRTKKWKICPVVEIPSGVDNRAGL